MEIGLTHPSIPYRARSFLEPAMWPIYVVVLIEALVIAAAVVSGAFRVDWSMAGSVLAEGSLVAGFAFAARWIGFPRIAAFVELTALSILSAMMAAGASLVLASSALPLADHVLHAADIILFGFDRDLIVNFLSRWPHGDKVSLWIYHSVAISAQFVTIALLWARGVRAALRLAVALNLAMVISLAIMPLLPAFGTPPYPYDFAAIMTGVRDGSIRVIEASTMTGLITFPSMHAAGGALLAWGFWQAGRWAAPLTALNLLVVLSAITSGGHYLVDVAAGVGVAAVSAAIAKRLTPA